MKKTLMNKNTVIMTIEYNPKYNAIDKIYEINNILHAPLSVLNENYSEEDLKMDTSKKYITIVNLSLVDEENVEVIRDFVANLGKELLATFDLLWTHGDETRLEKIAELKLEKTLKK